MIHIKKNPNSDTRTASKDVTFEQFQEANSSHIDDVFFVMEWLGNTIRNRGEMHDVTKKTQETQYYKDFRNTLDNGAKFTDGEWYKMHVKAERHHLFANCPEDVNLIDIIETIVDCVCAGLARSGEIRDLEFDNEILNRAVLNTVQMIKDNIVVEEDKKDEPVGLTFPYHPKENSFAVLDDKIEINQDSTGNPLSNNDLTTGNPPLSLGFCKVVSDTTIPAVKTIWDDHSDIDRISKEFQDPVGGENG